MPIAINQEARSPYFSNRHNFTTNFNNNNWENRLVWKRTGDAKPYTLTDYRDIVVRGMNKIINAMLEKRERVVVPLNVHFLSYDVSYDYAETFVNSLNSYNHLLDMGLHTLKVWDEMIEAKDDYKYWRDTSTRVHPQAKHTKTNFIRVASSFIGMAVMFDRLLAEVNERGDMDGTSEDIYRFRRYAHVPAHEFQATYNRLIQYERFDVWIPNKGEQLGTLLGQQMVQQLKENGVWWTDGTKVDEYHDCFGGKKVQDDNLQWCASDNDRSPPLYKIIIVRTDKPQPYYDVSYSERDPSDIFLFAIAGTGERFRTSCLNKGVGEGGRPFQVINTMVRRLMVADIADNNDTEAMTSLRAMVAYIKRILQIDRTLEGDGIVKMWDNRPSNVPSALPLYDYLMSDE